MNLHPHLIFLSLSFWVERRLGEQHITTYGSWASSPGTWGLVSRDKNISKCTKINGASPDQSSHKTKPKRTWSSLGSHFLSNSLLIIKTGKYQIFWNTQKKLYICIFAGQLSALPCEFVKVLSQSAICLQRWQETASSHWKTGGKFGGKRKEWNILTSAGVSHKVNFLVA